MAEEWPRRQPARPQERSTSARPDIEPVPGIPESGLMRRMRLPVRSAGVSGRLTPLYILSLLRAGGLGDDRLRESRRLDAELVELANTLLGDADLVFDSAPVLMTEIRVLFDFRTR